MRSDFSTSLQYPDPAQALIARFVRNVLCEIRFELLIAEGKIGPLAEVRHSAQDVVLPRYDRELRIGGHSPQQRILFNGCILLGGLIAAEKLGPIWDDSLHRGQARGEVGLCERR